MLCILVEGDVGAGDKIRVIERSSHDLPIRDVLRIYAFAPQETRRLLRYVFLSDSTNVAQEMMHEGYGHEYTYHLPYNYQKQFKEAERYARDHRVDLWAPDACLPR